MQREIQFDQSESNVDQGLFDNPAISANCLTANKKAAYWKQFFKYSCGKLFWRRQNGRIQPGCEAGSLCSDGYVNVTLHRKTYMVHRIIWEIHYGEITDQALVVHHKNKIRSDNRIENLELTTKSHNSFDSNRKKRKYPRGIYLVEKRRSTPWLAELAIEKKKYKKYFPDPFSALNWLNYEGQKKYGSRWVLRLWEVNP